VWARIKGMVQAVKPNDPPEPKEEVLPTWDVTLPPPAEDQPASAEPAASPSPEEGVPLALPVPPDAAAAEAVPVAQPVDAPAEGPALTDTAEIEALPAPLAEPAPAAPATLSCPVCGSSHQGTQAFCADCGYHFSPADLAGAGAPPAPPEEAPKMTERLQERFEVGELLSERMGVRRHSGLDWAGSTQNPTPVIIVQQLQAPAPEESAPVAEAVVLEAEEEDLSEDVLPSFDITPGLPNTDVMPQAPVWPNLDWETTLVQGLDLPALPRIVSQFKQGDTHYLVEEVASGRSLWDAWDDPEVSSEQRYGWLIQVAEALQRLHQVGIIAAALRPDILVVTPEDQVRFTDLSDLLPTMLPREAQIHDTRYTAPEVLTGQFDARADLYTFGAMLYALHVGRELSDSDFDRPGHPKPFIPRFPDIHPAFGRLVSKTFCRDVEARFPTDEASREDPTGMTELIRTLAVLGRTMDRVRLEIASWTTTGMVRTGNEDAFALLHSSESRQDDTAETALVLLCDGMGGYEAGEVAAALTIQTLRQRLVQQKPMAPLAGASAFPDDALSSVAHPHGHFAPPLDVEACKQLIKEALRDANKQVFTASRAPGSRRRGMGCTAEVVFTDGRSLIVGHVGDSRTYHLHEGRLIQLTRDQTLVNRLVELGTLTPEEAESHPRRNELQQAIGGQPDVEPGLYTSVLKPGDWVVVCSDGVTNHINAADLVQMLQSEAQSADMAARRLVNLTNIEGATDNATVVVIRAT
jgi:serine/threonine protein phosphatase PrpC